MDLKNIVEKGADIVKDVSEQHVEFKVFGFITAKLRREFIVTTFALCLVAIVYLVYDNQKLNQELVITKEQQRSSEQRLYEKMLEYFQPKLNLLDSANNLVKHNIIKQDSLQIKILKNIKK